MRTVRIALQGRDGRMGKEILAVCESLSQYKQDQSKFDVLIDFSSPEGAIQALEKCLEKKKPFLCGTTGLSQEQEKQLKKAAKKIPIFYSANFSMGLNAMVAATLVFEKKFKPQKIEIEETHHIHKQDRPSGTALYIKKQLEAAGAKVGAINSIREGEIFGIHKIKFFGKRETVIFEHRAESRFVFAEGALKVAVWLKKKNPGLYTMQDYLKGERK